MRDEKMHFAMRHPVAHFLFNWRKMHTFFLAGKFKYYEIMWFLIKFTCSTTFIIWVFLLIKHNDYVSGFEPRLLVAFPAKSDFLTISHACYPKEIILSEEVTKTIKQSIDNGTEGILSQISKMDLQFWVVWTKGIFFWWQYIHIISWAKQIKNKLDFLNFPRVFQFWGYFF